MPSRPPLRLLQVTSSSNIGGAEQLVLNVARYADPERLALFVLALMGEGPLGRLADQTGAQGFNWALRSLANPVLLRRMQLFLRRGQYDLVQTWGLRADLLTRWVARGMGLPLISSIASINPQRKWYQVALDRLTMDGVTAWISTSEAARRAYLRREKAPADRIFVVPTGIPDRSVPGEDQRRRARKKFKIAEGDGPVLAVVANIRPAKGYPDLIDAIAALRARHPRIVCLCAGRDDSGGKIPHLAKTKGLEPNLRWLGFLTDAPSVYEAADLAVLPSHWEGMPHALIEAIRAGIPTVATDVGGNSEVVRHEQEGLLCPPKSPAALADAISRALASDENRVTWGHAARRRYETCFRVETMVERMTEVYEYVTGRGPRPPY